MRCSSRGGPGSTATTGEVPTRNPGAVPLGSSTTAPTGTWACLRAPARIGSISPPIRLRSRVDDRPDPLLQRLVQDHRRARPPGDHLGGEVVRGRPEATAGQHQVDVREEVQGAPQIIGPVADHHDLGQLHAEPAQRLGQPGPVGVADQPRQHLGAGDDDARADAQVAQSPVRTDSLSRLGFLPEPQLVADRLADVGRGVALAAVAHPHRAVAEVDAEVAGAERLGARALLEVLAIDHGLARGVHQAHVDAVGGRELQGRRASARPSSSFSWTPPGWPWRSRSPWRSAWRPCSPPRGRSRLGGRGCTARRARSGSRGRSPRTGRSARRWRWR